MKKETVKNDHADLKQTQIQFLKLGYKWKLNGWMKEQIRPNYSELKLRAKEIIQNVAPTWQVKS